MPKHYEALQRAEEERRRKVSGTDATMPAAVSFEPAAAVERPKPIGIVARLLRDRKGAGVEEASESNKRRIALLQPDSYVAEQYRSLRGRIDSLASQQELKTIAVTSANAGEGKSTCAVNLAAVTAKSDSRIGYFHAPNMGEPGLREFGRYYYPQTLKEAMIIDDRWNGGGFVGDMIVDRLERQLWAMTAPREGGTGRNPERVHHGPVVVLINEDTYSNGEFFAETVKRKGLATLIGLRTWGGSTGIEPHQGLVDGGTTTPPQFGLYGLDGSWPIEGWGVEPHIIVVNAPDDVVAGNDAQLDAAIEFLLETLDSSGGKWDIPATPPYPVKAKPYMSKGK